MILSRDEKTIARILFKNKIYEADGQKFEDLFSQIMYYFDPNFIQIKPWGNIGDRKNDGYIKTKAAFFQVHAPEDSKNSYYKIIEKIQTDFNGLKRQWSNIEFFYYVLNDKYRGVHADAEKILDIIKKDNNLVECKFIVAKDLENILFQLTDDQISIITGNISNPKELKSLNYTVLNEILDHIKSQTLEYKIEKIVVPDWDEKIKFNNLGKMEETRLINGYFQLATLDEYLHNNSSFTSQELQNRIRSIYEELYKNYNGSNLFWELVSKLSPKRSSDYQASVIVIMSKYFATCDIFEEPIK